MVLEQRLSMVAQRPAASPAFLGSSACTCRIAAHRAAWMEPDTPKCCFYICVQFSGCVQRAPWGGKSSHAAAGEQQSGVCPTLQHCGVSFSGDIPDPPGQGPVQPALGDPASAGGLGWMTHRGPFQPRTFCDSLQWCYMQCHVISHCTSIRTQTWRCFNMLEERMLL